jgi:hypothetical protein
MSKKDPDGRRFGGLGLLFALTFLGASCDVLGPHGPNDYVIVRANGQPLPFVVTNGQLDLHSFVTILTSGSLHMDPTRRVFTLSTRHEYLLDGAATPKFRPFAKVESGFY